MEQAGIPEALGVSAKVHRCPVPPSSGRYLATSRLDLSAG